MAAAALMLGISSVFFFQTVFLPLILGGTAIILAILSKGYTRKLATTAKVAIGFAGSGIAIAVVMVGSALYMFISKPQILLDYGRQYDRMYEQMYGVTTEQALGMSYEELMNQYVIRLQNLWKGAADDNQ